MIFITISEQYYRTDYIGAINFITRRVLKSKHKFVHRTNNVKIERSINNRAPRILPYLLYPKKCTSATQTTNTIFASSPRDSAPHSAKLRKCQKSEFINYVGKATIKKLALEKRRTGADPTFDDLFIRQGLHY